MVRKSTDQAHRYIHALKEAALAGKSLGPPKCVPRGNWGKRHTRYNSGIRGRFLLRSGAFVALFQDDNRRGLLHGLGSVRKPVTGSIANRARASLVSSGSWLANITAWRRRQFSSFTTSSPVGASVRSGHPLRCPYVTIPHGLPAPCSSAAEHSSIRI